MTELHQANIRWLDNGVPFSETFGDIYFSQRDGLAESRHVFLEANNLEQRWSKTNDSRGNFIIGELGFGTGLNFLLCWQLWKSCRKKQNRLQYLAFEKHPLSHGDLSRALAKWEEIAPLSDQLLRIYPDHSAGLHRLHFGDNLTLDLWYEDALAALRKRHITYDASVNCWFLDGFKPKANPALWDRDIVSQIVKHSADDATFSTYSAAGQVRRNLQDCGFMVSRIPGFADKREMLCGSLPSRSRQDADLHRRDCRDRQPWFRYQANHFQTQSAIVIGAGLAGCSTAYSLARRGWQVTVLERERQVAAGASGNRQAALQIRLSRKMSAQAHFYLQAYLFAHRQFNQLSGSQSFEWHNCGVLRLPQSGSEADIAALVASYSSAVASYCSGQQCSEYANLKIDKAGVWLPQGGWLNPASLCHAYLNADSRNSIRLLTQQASDTLVRHGDIWQVIAGGQVAASAPVVVLANSYGVLKFEQTASLPLTVAAGQLSQIAASEGSSKLRSVVAGARYICPATDSGIHSVGASYRTDSPDLVQQPADDRHNMAGVMSIFPESMFTDTEILSSRVATRCGSRDHFPVVGAVPDLQAMTQEFGWLQRNARSAGNGSGKVFPGLFVNTSHGSFGLSSCPLSAELLASLICNENLPVSVSVMDSLNPVRFLIRDLKRQKLK